MSDHDDSSSSASDDRQALRTRALKELTEVMDEMETLLKSGDVIEALSGRGVNASLALVAVDGLRAYLSGQKAQAAEDLRTVADEIDGRLALTSHGSKGTPPS